MNFIFVVGDFNARVLRDLVRGEMSPKNNFSKVTQNVNFQCFNNRFLFFIAFQTNFQGRGESIFLFLPYIICVLFYIYYCVLALFIEYIQYIINSTS